MKVKPNAIMKDLAAQEMFSVDRTGLRLVGVWNPRAWSARASRCDLLQQHQRRPGRL